MFHVWVTNRWCHFFNYCLLASNVEHSSTFVLWYRNCLSASLFLSFWLSNNSLNRGTRWRWVDRRVKKGHNLYYWAADSNSFSSKTNILLATSEQLLAPVPASFTHPRADFISLPPRVTSNSQATPHLERSQPHGQEVFLQLYRFP